jgi:ABC-2 type transport system permease protein
MTVRARRIGTINWIGVATLCRKEVNRFLKIPTQTVLAPVVTTLLFLAVFTLALGGAVRMVGDIHFIDFLAPGLIIMAVAQNAFANSSSSLISAKMQGNIVDILMPPLGAGEIVFALVWGGVMRGLVVGAAVAVAMLLFAPLAIHDPFAIVFYAVSGAMMLALLGVLGGLWAEKFDQMSAVTNFVITPLSFLSGTFYSVERLPSFWHGVSQFNPFFYMIDGFRYGLIGHAESSLVVGVAVMTGVVTALWSLAYVLVARGYKLKA